MIIDSLQYIGIVGPLTLLSVLCPVSCVPLAVLIFIRSNASTRIEPRWLNWFEVVKLVSILVGVVAFIRAQFEPVPQIVFQLLLSVNILEAVLAELLLLGFNLNTVVGAGIVFGFCDPLSLWWIAVYSLWNATFSLALGFSHSTRLCLAVPVLVCMVLNDRSVWLSARTFSLVFNMLLRANQSTRIFMPGQSFLTNAT